MIEPHLILNFVLHSNTFKNLTFRLVMCIYALGYNKSKYHNENALEILQEKYIPMVVLSRIIQRSVFKQGDLINFVNGGMVPKTRMLSAFVKLMNAILN